MGFQKALEIAGAKGLSVIFHDFSFLLNGIGIFEIHKNN